MTYERIHDATPEYNPCRYGECKLLFRGPKRPLDGDYVGFLGSSETYGRFVERPFVDIVESEIGMPAANFGLINGGAEVFLGDMAVLDLAKRAKIKVVQVMGAHLMSNRLYSVHKRRNDRFLKPSQLLHTIYKDVDFTEFHFTRHLLRTLQERSEHKFELVRDELRSSWVARMKILVDQLGGNVVLLWMSDRSPDKTSDITDGLPPLFVDRRMLDELREAAPGVLDVVEVIAGADARARGSEGMLFAEVEAQAASELPGPAKHEEAADALIKALRPLLASRKGVSA